MIGIILQRGTPGDGNSRWMENMGQSTRDYETSLKELISNGET
jgi:hypothetical protein